MTTTRRPYALSSLRTKDNRLSVWRIDEDRGNLHRVVAALAAGRDFLDKLDYAVIDLQALDSLGIQAGVRTAFPDQVDAPVLRVTITASSATAP